MFEYQNQDKNLSSATWQG